MDECKPLIIGNGGELSESRAAEISLLLRQHLACYVNLFRTEVGRRGLSPG